MAWYRFQISSSNGKDQTFRWVDEHLGEDDEDELKFQLDSWVSETTVALNGERAFTASYERLSSLPPDTRRDMIATAQRRIEHATTLLEHLRADAIQNPDIDPAEDGNWVAVIREDVKQGTLAAEEADARAARIWELVERSQNSLAQYTSGVERRSAQQGAALARERAKKRREHR